jgi:hypothetical protein
LPEELGLQDFTNEIFPLWYFSESKSVLPLLLSSFRVFCVIFDTLELLGNKEEFEALRLSNVDDDEALAFTGVVDNERNGFSLHASICNG